MPRTRGSVASVTYFPKSNSLLVLRPYGSMVERIPKNQWHRGADNYLMSMNYRRITDWEQSGQNFKAKCKHAFIDKSTGYDSAAGTFHIGLVASAR